MAGTSLRLLVVLCLAVVLAWVFELGPSVEMPVAPDAMAHDQGFRHVVDVPPALLAGWPIPADSTDDPAASTAVVLEDGVPISMPHRIVDAIAERGRGRLSHWGSSAAQKVYLSSSDGSDPRANGRAYRVRFVRTPPSRLVTLAALVLLVACARRATTSSWTIPATIALVAGVVGVWISIFAGSVMISPDSSTYIRFHPWVPLGYPLFLALVSTVAGYTAVPAVQLVLLAVAVLYLASAVGRLTGSRLACAASALAVVGDAPMMRFAGAILSEALYGTLLLVCAGAGLRLVRHFSRSSAVVFALAAALAWSVRPAGVFLPLVALYLALLVRGAGRLRVAAWLVVATLGAFVLVHVGHRQWRGPAALSQTGRILFGVVALRLDPESVRPEYRADAERLAAAVAPYRREMESLPTWSERHEYASRNQPDRLTAADAALASRPSRDPAADAALLLGIAADTVTAHPAAYLRWVIEDVAWNWSTNVCAMLRTPTAVALGWYADNPEERERLIARFSMPLTMEQVTIADARAGSVPARAVDLLRRVLDAVFGCAPLRLALAVLLLVAIVAAPFAASPTVRAIGLLGAMQYGAIGAISATTSAIDRYMAPTDPLLFVAAVLVVHELLQHVPSRADVVRELRGARYSSGWNR